MKRLIIGEVMITITMLITICMAIGMLEIEPFWTMLQHPFIVGITNASILFIGLLLVVLGSASKSNGHAGN